MLKQFLFSLSLIGIFFFAACSENASEPSLNNEQEIVISKTTSMTSGNATIISVSNDNESHHWEVKIDMPGDGGIVKFEYNIGTNDLRQIKGLSPSFNYEIEPGNGLINYSYARSVALDAVSGNILEWKLEKDESDNNWQYRFEIESAGNNFEVRIDAANGTILRIKN